MIRPQDSAGARVQVVSGALWITQDTYREDHWLEADGALTLNRPGLALIHAQEPSNIVLFEPASRPGLRQRVALALAVVLRAVGRSLALHFGPDSIDRRSRPGWYHGL